MRPTKGAIIQCLSRIMCPPFIGASIHNIDFRPSDEDPEVPVGKGHRGRRQRMAFWALFASIGPLFYILLRPGTCEAHVEASSGSCSKLWAFKQIALRISCLLKTEAFRGVRNTASTYYTHTQIFQLGRFQKS